MDLQYRGLIESSNKRKINRERKVKEKVGNVYDYLLKEYIVNKKSLDDISLELGCSKSYVSKLLKRNGIKVRSRWENNIGSKHPMTEEQKMKLREVFSKPEVKNKRSIAQKKVWASLTKEEKQNRVRNGNIERTKRAMEVKISSIEIKVKNQLDFYNIRYIQQKRVCDFENNRIFYLDFYLPEYKLVIECNGCYWHKLPNRMERDSDLKKYVESTGRKIVFIWENEIKDEWFNMLDYIEGVF